MAKKKRKVNKVKTTDAVGTPSMLLLPSRNYKFKVHDNVYSMTLPRKGKYVDLDSEVFTDEDGEFELLKYSEEDDTHTLFIPSISKVLFAINKYPDMQDAYAFTPVAFIFGSDEVEIIGNLIEMVQKEN